MWITTILDTHESLDYTDLMNSKLLVILVAVIVVVAAFLLGYILILAK